VQEERHEQRTGAVGISVARLKHCNCYQNRKFQVGPISSITIPCKKKQSHKKPNLQ
jgi:hypothetical protein